MTTITFNRPALFALIDADPEFALQLKNNVIAEVGRRFFEKDAKRVIAAAEPELFAQALKSIQDDKDMTIMIQRALASAVTVKTSEWYAKREMSPEVKKVIDTAVEDIKRRAIADASMQVGNAYSEAIQKAVDAKLATTNVDELIEKRVNRLLEVEINKLAQEKFEQRMADLRAMMK
ncbi:MAG: hypothetical protein EOQ80_04685 [Mesorhizobium sp.]|uniref:hypothetical protein n=1 Tax=Mesorhizobium sp. TaxID=1871066 RepID=UPI000FE7F385|nr:hypothetical protein [Mesorhizobium sp.]RWH50271.1 MAG: hypothetical protein EOQ80_04685 [Mesorhizobium sp.]TIQ64386.1 MAG: hypothetical protein E5X41_17140 [Mesorhizobium sp.]